MSGARVLVVEDEIGIADALRRGLSADGFVVDVATTGTEGLAAARRRVWDVIVLDLMLPGVSGEEICATIRDEGDEVAVLMLTAKDTDHEQITGLRLGADDYVIKPFSYVALRARLHALLRRIERLERAAVADELRVGDLVLDRQRVTVRRGDAEIDLSPRMLAVLEHLMEHEGITISKSQLLDAVWGPAFDGADNVVEVTVSRLRQAIDAPFDRATLQTVRGLGYRVRDDGGGS